LEEVILQGQVELIREVFMYAQRFYNKRFVIMISSGVIEDTRFPSLVRDLAILHKSGIQILLVPGAGKRIDEVLGAYGQRSELYKGIRISTPEQMPFIKMAAFDVANKLMTQLSSLHVDSVIGSWVRARGIGVVDGVDYHETGLVSRVDSRLLSKVLEDGMIPILPCIGWSSNGSPYNISSLELATYLAESLEAEKLFFLTDAVELNAQDYHLPEEGTVVHEEKIIRLSVPAAKDLLRLNGKLKDSMEYQLVELAARAASKGVSRVHIINGRVEGVILKEIFSSLGFGAMVHSDPYESIRDMLPEDVPSVLDIMEPNIQAGLLVRREQQDLEKLYQDFVVFEADGSIRGCGALHRFKDGSGEVAGIAVDPHYEDLGLGQKIVTYLISKARRQQYKKLFVLTTKAGDWFETLGFQKTAPDDLPAERRAKYNPSRNSRVFSMNLTEPTSLLEAADAVIPTKPGT
jgi:amino-acid N-acetyltransferase